MPINKGLVYVWATATASLFTLWILYSVFTPIMGTLDNIIYHLMTTLPMAPGWMEMYQTWSPILRNWLGILSVVCFVSLIVYVLLNSMRVENTQIPY